MKISTVAAKQGRKISERKLTLGLDLGESLELGSVQWETSLDRQL